MNYISHQNTGKAAIDCAVIMLAGSSQTEGIVVKEFLNLGAGEGIAFTPTLSGIYGVGTKAEGSEDDYVLDDDYAPRYIYPGNPNGHKPVIKGFSIAEFNDFYRVRFCITDDMNSDVYFQNYMFELLYAYIDGEETDYQAGVTEFASSKTPTFTSARVRNSSSPSRADIKYPYPVMIIDDRKAYDSAHNIKAASDLLYFQHKMMYLGDTVMIPKIEGQSEPGRYLIFAVRRREIGKPMSEISEMSGTYIMPIALQLTPVILEQSKTSNRTPAVATAKASCVLSGANDSTLTFTATKGGSKYNSLVVKMLGGESKKLDITIDETGYEMTIQLETNEAGKSISTLAEVKEEAEKVKATLLEGGGSYNFGVIEISGGDEDEVIDLVETYAFTGGADNGTIAVKDKILYDSGKAYIATRDMDGSEEDLSGWKAIDLYDAESAKSVDSEPTVIDLSDALENYVIEDKKNSIVVLTDNAATAYDIILPAAIVGLRVTIINQDDAPVSIRPVSGEYINGTVDNLFNLTTLNSATFYCYADGYWAII